MSNLIEDFEALELDFGMVKRRYGVDENPKLLKLIWIFQVSINFGRRL